MTDQEKLERIVDNKDLHRVFIGFVAVEAPHLFVEFYDLDRE